VTAPKDTGDRTVNRWRISHDNKILA
jgi:hypothetical protein